MIPECYPRGLNDPVVKIIKVGFVNNGPLLMADGIILELRIHIFFFKYLT